MPPRATVPLPHRTSDSGVIVLSAFSCAPRRGSEAEVGWQAIQAIRGHYEAYVFVDGAYRDNFTSGDLKSLNEDRIHVCFRTLGVPLTRLLGGGVVRRNLYYSLWQMHLPRWIAKELSGRKILLAHHVTWAKYSSPSHLYRLRVPLIIGPVGGGEVAPIQLQRALRPTQRVREMLRWLVQQTCRFDPILRASYRAARIVWTSTSETKREVCRFGATGAVSVRSQAAVTTALGRVDPGNYDRVVTSGRILGLKGFWLVLEAFFKTSDRVKELVVIGDGPDLARLRSRASQLERAGKRVVFKGWLSLADAQEELRKGFAFCFASLHDSAGFVVLEALSVGMPVVCLKCGGPAALVTPDCGVAVVPTDVDGTAREMAAALDTLSSNPARWETYSRNAVERANLFTPERRHVDIRRDYANVVAEATGATSLTVSVSQKVARGV